MTAIRGGRMILYTQPLDFYSHRVRIVLAEKGVNFTNIEINTDSMPPELTDINPYGLTPTLVDRDLVLYDSRVIMEYLDERFPHPPLLPVYPVARAKSRLMVFRIEQDWYKQAELIEYGDFATAKETRAQLTQSLIQMAPVFKEYPFFLNEEFSLVDCTLAPVLWRLSSLGIALPKEGQPLLDYAKRIFKRDSFQTSLTENEREVCDEEHVI